MRASLMFKLAITGWLPVPSVATQIKRDASGAVTGWRYGNGLERRHTFDIDGRATGISVGDAASVLQSLTYQHDAGNAANEANVKAGMSAYDAYRNNPFEVPAFDMGARILDDLNAQQGGPCGCAN